MIASCFGNDPLISKGKREKPLQFEWKFSIVLCAILFTSAISVEGSSSSLYSVSGPDSTPEPSAASTSTSTTTPQTSRESSTSNTKFTSNTHETWTRSTTPHTYSETSNSKTASTSIKTTTSRKVVPPRTLTRTSVTKTTATKTVTWTKSRTPRTSSETSTSTSTSTSSTKTTPWRTTTTPSTMVVNSEFISPRDFSGGHIRLIERNEWMAALPSEGVRKLETPVQDVIISHTATEFCNTTSECSFRVRSMQTFDMESRHWSDITFNFLVGGDGVAYVGLGWDYEGAATPNYNHRSISISFIGTYNSVAPSTQQLQTAQDLIELGVELGKIAPDYSLLGQRQLDQTSSPGDELYKIIQTWPHWHALL